MLKHPPLYESPSFKSWFNWIAGPFGPFPKIKSLVVTYNISSLSTIGLYILNCGLIVNNNDEFGLWYLLSVCIIKFDEINPNLSPFSVSIKNNIFVFVFLLYLSSKDIIFGKLHPSFDAW